MPSAAQNTNLSKEVEFESYLEEALENPKVREAFEDAELVQGLIDALVELRKQQGLNQTELAAKMGVKQPTVSGFETEGSDPRISSLQRYARALDARIEMKVLCPSAAEFSGRLNVYIDHSESTPKTHVRTEAPSLDARFLMEAADSYRHDFALAA